MKRVKYLGQELYQEGDGTSSVIFNPRKIVSVNMVEPEPQRTSETGYFEMVQPPLAVITLDGGVQIRTRDPEALKLLGFVFAQEKQTAPGFVP